VVGAWKKERTRAGSFCNCRIWQTTICRSCVSEVISFRPVPWDFRSFHTSSSGFNSGRVGRQEEQGQLARLRRHEACDRLGAMCRMSVDNDENRSPLNTYASANISAVSSGASS
jgi:hypothetical protein